MLRKRLENTMHRCMECLEVGMKGKVQLLIEGVKRTQENIDTHKWSLPFNFSVF